MLYVLHDDYDNKSSREMIMFVVGVMESGRANYNYHHHHHHHHHHSPVS